MHTDAGEATTAAEAVLLTVMTFGRRLKTRLSGDEIDPVFLPLLHTLRCSGPVRVGDLAQAADLDASTISRHVRHLEDSGLVTRSEHPDDRRASLVSISGLGEQLLATTFRHRRALIDEALDDWSDGDLEALRTTLNRLTHSLDARTHRASDDLKANH